MKFKEPLSTRLTFEEIAEEIGVSPERIQRYVECGALKPCRPDGSTPEIVAIVSQGKGGGHHCYGAECRYATRQELERFKAEHSLTAAMTVRATEEINPKEKETLLKLIAVLASDGYGYDPTQKKNPLHAEIQKAGDLLGISFDVDTVRKWLKKASDFLPPKEDHSAT